MAILPSWFGRDHRRRRELPAPNSLPVFDVRALIPSKREYNEDLIRARCQAVSVAPAQTLARVLGRYKMYVDPQDYGLSPHLMLDGYWEMPTTEALVQCIRPGMVVADVGANVGYFTILMADLVGSSGKVMAFEPNPAMAERIRRSAYLNGLTERVEIYSVALHDANCPVSFLMPSDEPKNAYISPYEGVELTGGVILDAERLDSRAAWHSIELLKIDAEGSEERIWAGASGLRQSDRLRTIVLEFQPGRYTDPRAFIENICSWGFSLEWIDPALGIEAVTIEAILARRPDEDIMLVFRR
ncbi:methyltransferase FkbM family [Sphingobium chlorophenolicum L-1]|uniref:Methyltransferase FkbM family n=1 Tax=Sphingobium chlorophenolicum L-1 TaxID=690566 RepID=F6F0L8_SPHCR|nr:FkbM family methyltransferase [Sphingobium chlorophenolicum]AEG50340.1 methyltransferase FkbM family [Sphingobium chlorophenolicum L-1]